MVGVMVHKQYGFGFFYWPVQMYAMGLIGSVFYFIGPAKLFGMISKIPLFNTYFLLILSIQLTSFLNRQSYVPYLEDEELVSIITETIIWYFVLIPMIIHYERLVKLASIKIMTLIYFVIVILFFLYVIKLNVRFGGGVIRAFWVGANFPTIDIDPFLSASGYVKGFHLYFSPLFSIFSLLFIALLKDKKKSMTSYGLYVFSLYILFLASGRGSLIAFMVVALYYYFRDKKALYTLLVLLVSIVFLISSGFFDELAENNSRLFDLLTLNFEEDNSSLGRLQQFEMNTRYINANWLLGGIRSYYTILGEGEYIHNVLSVWQEYGLITFLVLILLFMKGSYLVLTKKGDAYPYLLAKAIFIYMLLEAAMFKNIHEVKILIPLIITYYYILNYRSNVKYASINEPPVINTSYQEIKKDKIKELLLLAKQQFSSKEQEISLYDSPKSTYNKILLLEPNNRQAKSGIIQIKDNYVLWARDEMKRGNQKNASFLFKKALEISPYDSRILAIIKMLEEKKPKKIAVESSQSKTLELLDTQEGIKKLLAVAELQIAKKNLTPPDKNSAFAIYRTILKRFPGHVSAYKGINKIKITYVNWAKFEISRGDYQLAESLYSKALKIAPTDSEIIANLEKLRKT